MGKNTNSVWQVYATPYNPITCPVLALARFLFSNLGILTPVANNDKDWNPKVETDAINPDLGLSNIFCHWYMNLFPGRTQYDQFMKCFWKVILENEEEFCHMGIQDGDLGSHSSCKGSCSYSSSGSTVSPPIVSICVQAMWSMSTVEER